MLIAAPSANSFPGCFERMQVVIATSEQELEDISRLRYAIYVSEQKKSLTHANHQARTLLEPSDNSGTNIYIKNNDNEIVAAGRLHLGAVSDETDRVLKRQEIELVSAGRAAFVSRVVVQPQYRKGPLTGLLLQALYKHGIDSGCHTALALVRKPNQQIFQKTGFIQYSQDEVVPEFGEVAPMVLPAADPHYIALHAPLFHKFLGSISRDSPWIPSFWAWLRDTDYLQTRAPEESSPTLGMQPTNSSATVHP